MTTPTQTLPQNEGKRFDICLMNPPYDKNLHLKFLEKVIGVAEKTVSIQPIDWMLRIANYDKDNSQFNKYYNKFKKYYVDIEKLTIQDNINLFGGARISNILGIQYLNHENNNFLEEFTYNSPESQICTKILKFAKKDNIEEHLEKDKKDGYRVKFGRIGGGGWDARKPHRIDCFKEIVIDGKLKNGEPHWKMNSINQYTKKTDTMEESLQFDTEKDANNFIEIYNTKIMQYYMAYIHQDIHITPKNMPYFKNEQLKFRDKELCKLFNISGYISDTKAEPDSEWETVLKLWNEYK